MNGFVYILSNDKNEVFYVGITSNLKRRLYEHRNHLISGFTDKYNITKVLYVESSNYIIDSIKREKQIKKWSKNKKINLVKTVNPYLIDLYDEIMSS